MVYRSPTDFFSLLYLHHLQCDTSITYITYINQDTYTRYSTYITLHYDT